MHLSTLWWNGASILIAKTVPNVKKCENFIFFLSIQIYSSLMLLLYNCLILPLLPLFNDAFNSLFCFLCYRVGELYQPPKESYSERDKQYQAPEALNIVHEGHVHFVLVPLLLGVREHCYPELSPLRRLFPYHGVTAEARLDQEVLGLVPRDSDTLPPRAAFRKFYRLVVLERSRVDVPVDGHERVFARDEVALCVVAASEAVAHQERLVRVMQAQDCRIELAVEVHYENLAAVHHLHVAVLRVVEAHALVAPCGIRPEFLVLLAVAFSLTWCELLPVKRI